MRISIPTIPESLLASSSSLIAAGTGKAAARTILPEEVTEASERIARFLSPGNVVLLTGAGVSVDSGIRAYRGRDGRYMNPGYK